MCPWSIVFRDESCLCQCTYTCWPHCIAITWLHWTCKNHLSFQICCNCEVVQKKSFLLLLFLEMGVEITQEKLVFPLTRSLHCMEIPQLHSCQAADLPNRCPFPCLQGKRANRGVDLQCNLSAIWGGAVCFTCNRLIAQVISLVIIGQHETAVPEWLVGGRSWHLEWTYDLGNGCRCSNYQKKKNILTTDRERGEICDNVSCSPVFCICKWFNDIVKGASCLRHLGQVKAILVSQLVQAEKS